MLPEDYFKKLPEKLWSNISSLEDNVENDAPTLFKLGKRNPYNVPSNYFVENLGKYIKGRSTQLLPNRKKIVFAATFFVLAGIGIITFLESQKDSEISESEMMEYYMDNLDEVDENLLVFIDEEYDTETEELSDEEAEVYYKELVEELTDYELDNLF